MGAAGGCSYPQRNLQALGGSSSRGWGLSALAGHSWGASELLTRLSPGLGSPCTAVLGDPSLTSSTSCCAGSQTHGPTLGIGNELVALCPGQLLAPLPPPPSTRRGAIAAPPGRASTSLRGEMHRAAGAPRSCCVNSKTSCLLNRSRWAPRTEGRRSSSPDEGLFLVGSSLLFRTQKAAVKK